MIPKEHAPASGHACVMNNLRSHSSRLIEPTICLIDIILGPCIQLHAAIHYFNFSLLLLISK